MIFTFINLSRFFFPFLSQVATVQVTKQYVVATYCSCKEAGVCGSLCDTIDCQFPDEPLRTQLSPWPENGSSDLPSRSFYLVNFRHILDISLIYSLKHWKEKCYKRDNLFSVLALFFACKMKRNIYLFFFKSDFFLHCMNSYI